MAQSMPARPKINTNPTQVGPGRRSRRPAGQAAARTGRTSARVAGEARSSSRDSERLVVEAGWGVVVYPPEAGGGVWRAVFTENGPRLFHWHRLPSACRPFGRTACKVCKACLDVRCDSQGFVVMFAECEGICQAESGVRQSALRWWRPRLAAGTCACTTGRSSVPGRSARRVSWLRGLSGCPGFARQLDPHVEAEVFGEEVLEFSAFDHAEPVVTSDECLGLGSDPGSGDEYPGRGPFLVD